MAYGCDLRERVVHFVKNVRKNKRGSKREASLLFKVSEWCVYNWLKADKLEANKTGPKAPHKVDPEALKAHVEAHPDAYQHEIAEAFGVKQPTICVRLKKLKITRKKTVLYQERNEEQRTAYLAILKGNASQQKC